VRTVPVNLGPCEPSAFRIASAPNPTRIRPRHSHGEDLMISLSTGKVLAVTTIFANWFWINHVVKHGAVT
jgi:hypothetical protein